METSTLTALITTTAMVGFIHTITGPDHFVPFIAMSKAGRWSITKTIVVTALCGVGHVLGSIILGFLGIALGWSVGRLEWFEGHRGTLAGWLMIAFGLIYAVWGLRRAARGKKHSHWHAHADGTVHNHDHTHVAGHVHVHAEVSSRRSMTPWILFTIFVFGPCEPLIPILMYPAAANSILALLLIVAVFALCTIGTMTLVVTIACLGLVRFEFPRLATYSHALAGLAIIVCGAAVQMGL